MLKIFFNSSVTRNKMIRSYLCANWKLSGNHMLFLPTFLKNGVGATLWNGAQKRPRCHGLSH